MVGLGSPLSEGIQKKGAHSAQQGTSAQQQAKSEGKALSPLEVLILFCQAPAALECFPNEKMAQILGETAKLHRALRNFMEGSGPEPASILFSQMGKTENDVSILQFAACLWGNPEIGMQLRDEMEKCPPKSNSGKLLHSLLKPLSMETCVSFWQSQGVSPPGVALRKVCSKKPGEMRGKGPKVVPLRRAM
jgi:hypothetical protein